MFLQTGKWLAIPEPLHIALVLLFGVLAAISTIALILGIVKKKKSKYFVLWSTVILISAAYLIASLGFGWIVANTMISG
ncbi:hypothetical protein [uncultured Ruthenibacterium sp.]|uniref:hypothetical protein n=1 Tax=uncultured Ruthenibacterium sp. TaxID=1905347 RepID=UPI00349E4E6B